MECVTAVDFRLLHAAYELKVKEWGSAFYVVHAC